MPATCQPHASNMSAIWQQHISKLSATHQPHHVTIPPKNVGYLRFCKATRKDLPLIFSSWACYSGLNNISLILMSKVGKISWNVRGAVFLLILLRSIHKIIVLLGRMANGNKLSWSHVKVKSVQKSKVVVDLLNALKMGSAKIYIEENHSWNYYD